MIKSKTAYFIFIFFFIITNAIGAESIKKAVEKTIKTNPAINAAIKKYESSNKDIEIAKAGYKPTVDLSTFVGIKKEHSSTDNYTTNGIDTSIRLTQSLYDGGYVSNNIEIAKSEQKALFYQYKQTKEKTVLEAVKTYLDLYKNIILQKLMHKNYLSHKKIMKIAKDNEKISGEIIDKLETQTRVKLLEIEINDNKILIQKLKNKYKKIVGSLPKTSKMCKPPLKMSYIPHKIQDMIDIALSNNPKYLAALQNIKTTQNKLKLESSKFYPKIKLSANSNYDKNYQDEDTITKQTSAKINLDYNIYNGNKDTNSIEKYKLLYAEAFELSTDSKDEIISNIKEYYHKLKDTKQSLKDAKIYLDITYQLVQTNEQKFQLGTKTVIDLLNSRDKYNRAKQKVLNIEFQRLKDYYSLLNIMGILSDTILSTTKECDYHILYKVDKKIKTKQIQKTKLVDLDSELKSLQNFFNNNIPSKEVTLNSNIADDDFDILKAIQAPINKSNNDKTIYIDKQKLKEDMLKNILDQAYGLTNTKNNNYFDEFDNVDKHIKNKNKNNKIFKPKNIVIKQKDIKKDKKEYEGFGFDEIDKLLNDDFEQSYLKKRAKKSHKIIKPDKNVQLVRTIHNKNKKTPKKYFWHKSYTNNHSFKINKNYIIYKVQKGDTLWSISKKYKISIQKLMKFNHLKNHILEVNDILKIPMKKISKYHKIKLKKQKERKIRYNNYYQKNKTDIEIEDVSQNNSFVLINDTFEQRFKHAKSGYTLLLGSFKNYKSAAEFTIWNGLDNNSIIVKKGKRRYVLYGIYNSYYKAKNEILKLSSSIKYMKPQVVKINKWN